MGSQIAKGVALAGLVILMSGGCTEAGPQQVDSQPAATAASGLLPSTAVPLNLIPTLSSTKQASTSQSEETYSAPTSSLAETHPGSTNSLPAPALVAAPTEIPSPAASGATSDPAPDPTETPRPTKELGASPTPTQALAPVYGSTSSKAATATPSLALNSTVSRAHPPEEAIIISAKPMQTPVQPADSLGNEVDDLAFAFTLPSATGVEVSLDSLLEKKNVVLVFYRAFW